MSVINNTLIRAFLRKIAADSSFKDAMETTLLKMVTEVNNDDEAGKEVVNGSAEGTNFAAQITMTKFEKMELFELVLEYAEAGTVPTDTSYGVIC